jgi:hypothetical protein
MYLVLKIVELREADEYAFEQLVNDGADGLQDADVCMGDGSTSFECIVALADHAKTHSDDVGNECLNPRVRVRQYVLRVSRCAHTATQSEL